MAETMPDLPDDYPALLDQLRRRIADARLRAASAVNRELVLLYWRIGADILDRQRTQGWGAGVITRLAADLRRSFPDMTGLSPRNLGYMRSLAGAYPDIAILQQAAAQLPWGHLMVLLDRVKDTDTRDWYARQAAEHGWSRAVLLHQLDTGLRERSGGALTNFAHTLPPPQSDLAQQLLKDPYVFDFLGLADSISERQLEQALFERLKDFMLELGKGFAFVGQQYRLAVAGEDYFLDLLFFNFVLNCFVVIDLKVVAFKPEFAGKMNFYLSAVDDLLRGPGHNSSIGIILCQDRNEVVVEYALRGTAKPMGVARYQLLPPKIASALPSAEELSRELAALPLLRLRDAVERTLLSTAAAHGVTPPHHKRVGALIRELENAGVDLPGSDRFMEALRTLNAAAMGLPARPDDVARAQAEVEAFLQTLRRSTPDAPPSDGPPA